MKKLLLSLGALGISASLPMTVVACSTNNMEKINKIIHFENFTLNFQDNTVTRPKDISLKNNIGYSNISNHNLDIEENINGSYKVFGDIYIYGSMLEFYVNKEKIHYYVTIKINMSVIDPYYITNKTDLDEILKDILNTRQAPILNFYTQYINDYNIVYSKNQLYSLLTTKVAGEYSYRDGYAGRLKNVDKDILW